MKTPFQKAMLVIGVLLLLLVLWIDSPSPSSRRAYQWHRLLSDDFQYINSIRLVYNDEDFLLYGEKLEDLKYILGEAFRSGASLPNTQNMAYNHLLSMYYYIDDTLLFNSSIIYISEWSRPKDITQMGAFFMTGYGPAFFAIDTFAFAVSARGLPHNFLQTMLELFGA